MQIWEEEEWDFGRIWSSVIERGSGRHSRQDPEGWTGKPGQSQVGSATPVRGLGGCADYQAPSLPQPQRPALSREIKSLWRLPDQRHPYQRLLSSRILGNVNTPAMNQPWEDTKQM